ncbi:mitochondrial tricarboxylate transporter [Basidiobolus meristosporus CBS 931.73]|uniref:Mitochondrial tricarboxylate transporter n=1 Tax=Basidiobolus meristosporus CBS 931.73 TaxID=1314790 RepID=A0A1Y1Y8Q7_9FUNG|nr:mitochondrial tricarboxylate transporter [Basidiobolus meristosporus CBS 931.73]|eukprot:ORX94377.1 mitochondrial tricarboxylate transporter [Basidiobolus meristosporus CBS 931.73]
MSTQTKKDKPLFSLVAGGVAGAIEAAATYPTEYVKTQIQLQGKSATSATHFKGPLDCLMSTVKNQGFFSLYRGLSAMLIGNSSKAAIRFYSFNYFKNLLADEKGQLSAPRSLLAGLGAGMSEAILVVTPTETIKTKLIQDQNTSHPRYKGLVHGTSQIIKEEGILGIYRGLTAVMLRQGANQAVRFTVYNFLKQEMQKRTKPGQQIHWATTFGMGMIAGTVTVYSTMPFDVVKTKMQSIHARQLYKNTLHCMWVVFRDEGVFALWKGATPRLSRLVFSGGIVFTVYEQVMKLFNYLSPQSLEQ